MAHTFHLDAAERTKGIVASGEASRLLARLDAGEPVQIGILGSSVGEQGGCQHQPGKQCQQYDGVSMARPGWGTPRRRPFAGYLVRFLRWINATWPHAHHGIYNGAQGAKPLSAALPCLDLHAPPRLDLVVLEPLSSGFPPRSSLETVVRLLLSRQPPPTIVLLSATLWYRHLGGEPASSSGACLTNRHNYAKAGFVDAAGALPTKSSFARGERMAVALCRHYRLSCLSMYSALIDGVRSGRPGFSKTEVAADCLHPMHGTLGTEYVTDVLVEWLSSSRLRHGLDTTVPLASATRNSSLPLPLLPGAIVRDSDRQVCYTFDEATLGDRWLPDARANKRALAWHTAACPSPCGALQKLDEARSTPPPKCPQARRGVGSTTGTSPFVPSAWFYCYLSMAPNNPKRSPGVVALRPAATLYVPLRPHEAVGASNGDDLCISLWYLTSFEQMGSATLRCGGGCSCSPREINAHRAQAQTSRGRNVSLYDEHTARVTTHHAREECVLILRVNERTESGGHKFKLSDLNLRRIRAPVSTLGDGACGPSSPGTPHQVSGDV